MALPRPLVATVAVPSLLALVGACKDGGGTDPRPQSVPVAAIEAVISDEFTMVGRSPVLAIIAYDANDNVIESGATFTFTGSPGVTVGANRRVSMTVGGPARIVVASGEARDTVDFTVMPAGRLAAAPVEQGGLSLMDLDGENFATIAGVSPVGQYGLRPAWTPDGSRVIVHSWMNASGSARLNAVTVATGAVQALNATPNVLVNEWYPDAARTDWLYFSGETASGLQTWRMRYDGTGAQQLPATAPSYPQYYRPALSPDGARMAVSVVIDGEPAVRVFNATSGAAIGNAVAPATSPRWSPDGQFVAFSSVGFGPIGIMRADGTMIRALNEGAYYEWFDWTSDGKWIVARSIDTERLEAIRVSDGLILPIPGTAGLWQPALRR